MSAIRLPNLAISSVRTQKGVTSVHARKATSCRRTEGAAKILMSVQLSSTTASSCVLTPLAASHVNVLLDLPNTIRPALITMNAPLTSTCVGQRAFARTLLEASLVNASGDSHLIRAAQAVKMWTSVRGTIAASTAARTSSGATGAAAPRAISSTTNGTSVSMKMNASVLTSAEEPPVTTPWGATSACVLPASNTNSSVEVAKTSTNAALLRPPAVMAVPILRAATCVPVHLATSE